MGQIKQAMIREADADSLDNASECNRLRKLVAVLRTRIRRQDGRRWKPWHEDYLWWAEMNETHDGA